MRIVVKPEVKSPAGYWPQLRAAVEAGADAVYFGLKHFTARAKVGFSLAELPEVMATLQVVHVREHTATARVINVVTPDIQPGASVVQVAKLP